MANINIQNWVITNAPPPPKRRAEVQAAYDFFWSLPVGSSALIPADEASTARNAASQLKSDFDGAVEVRFRNEGDLVRATKVKDFSAEQKARLDAGLPAEVGNESESESESE